MNIYFLFILFRELFSSLLTDGDERGRLADRDRSRSPSLSVERVPRRERRDWIGVEVWLKKGEV